MPYVVPFPELDRFGAWRSQFGDVAVAIATFLAAAWGIGRVRAKAERRFWRFVAVAYGVAFVAQAASGPVLGSGGQVWIRLSIESLYLIFLLILFLAAGVRPDYGEGGGWKLDRLRAAGLGVLAMGLAVYFQVVPSAANPDRVGSWYPNLYLFALLDVMVSIAFLRASREQEDARWRRILAGMAAVTAAYAVVDAAEATLYLEPFYQLEIPAIWDIAWYVPEFMFLVVARVHVGSPLRSGLPGGPRFVPRLDRGALVAILIALPLLHVLLDNLGVVSPELRNTREGVVIVYLLVMGALTLVYLWTLERERDRGRRELTLSEERYRSFVTARSDRVYRAEANPPIRLDQSRDDLVREVETRLLIAEAGEVPGRPTSPSDPTESIGCPLVEVLGPDRAHGNRILREWIDSGYDVDDIEIREEVPGAEPRYCRYSVMGIVEDGGLVRAWVTVSDVTAQRLAALETERLERELEHAQKMESIGTFAGGIAHDFNNLLLPIIGFTELVVADTRPEDEASRESLGQVLRASRRAADLVNQVLSVSRSQPRSEIAVRTQDVIREALRLIRPGLPTTVKIETAIDDTCPPILGDPSRVHQVLMNLCANSAQAIGSRHGCISIQLVHDARTDQAPAPRGWVVLEVTDDGPGIAPDLLVRVFEPFFTTKAAGEGTGLGLSIVHGIVVSHGGHVSIDSEPGSGTTVTVRIPATDRAVESSVAADAAPMEPLRVLVVDDEEVVANVTHQMLAASGHAVASLTDPASALDTIRAGLGEFDLLLTDYTMPGMTGHELARAAQALAPDLRVVIMSGLRLRSVDPDDEFLHLAKPFTSDELTATMRLAVTPR